MYNNYKLLYTATVEPGCKVFSDVRSIFFSRSQSESAILSYNPDVWSARLLGQLSLDKTQRAPV